MHAGPGQAAAVAVPKAAGGRACGRFLLLEVRQRKPQRFPLSLTAPLPLPPCTGPAPAGGGLGGGGDGSPSGARPSSGKELVWGLVHLETDIY